MEKREMSFGCCAGFSGKHRKILAGLMFVVLLAIILLAIAIAGWKIREAKRQGFMMDGKSGRGQMMRGWKGACPIVNPSDVDNQFFLPQDALRSGEIAIKVGDLESAKKAISDIAVKENGSIYATFIAYDSSDLKNGSIVVQVPAENFNSTFDGLKKVGSQVVQESTKQIAPMNYYPMAAAEKAADVPAPGEEGVAVSSLAQDAKPEIAIYPAPVQPAQDKGYVKVIFVDYGKTAYKEERKEMMTGNILGVGNPTGGNIKNNLFVVIGIKLILLIAIIGLLIAMLKKIFHRISRRRENSKKVHVVRQLSRTHKRVVKVQAKKKK